MFINPLLYSNIGLASITSSYLSGVVVEASPKDGKKKKRSPPLSRVTKQKFRVLIRDGDITLVTAEVLDTSVIPPKAVPSIIGTRSYIKGDVYSLKDVPFNDENEFTAGEIPAADPDFFFNQECTVTEDLSAINPEAVKEKCRFAICTGKDEFEFPNCVYLIFSGILFLEGRLGEEFKSAVIGGSGDFLGTVGEALITIRKLIVSETDPGVVDISINTISTISELEIAEIETFD